MRVVIQRVTSARLVIGDQEVREIGAGLVILVGIEQGDTREDIAWLSGKVSRLRIFNDPDGIMNLSVTETSGEVMVVSQFTLHASTRKGNRPSYIRAAPPEKSIPVYKEFVDQLAMDLGREVVTGEFGAYMQISLTNDGPVTILMDTKRKE